MKLTWLFEGLLVVNAVVCVGATLPLLHYECDQAPDLPLHANWHDAYHRNGEASRDIMYYFDILDPALSFETPAPCIPVGELYASDSVREASSTSSLVAAMSTQNTLILTDEISSALLRRLTDCMSNRLCGVIEVRFRQRPGSLTCLAAHVVDSQPSVRRPEYRCAGESLQRQCNGVSVFFYKNIVRSMQRVLAVQQIQEDHTAVCQVIRLGMLCMPVLLNVLNGFMFVVVWKFVTNRCGDHVAVEIQFEVDLESDSETECDFGVRTSRSSQASTRNSARPGTRQRPSKRTAPTTTQRDRSSTAVTRSTEIEMTRVGSQPRSVRFADDVLLPQADIQAKPEVRPLSWGSPFSSNH